jgi:hypothetical protein
LVYEVFKRGKVDAVSVMVYQVVKEVNCGKLVMVGKARIRKGESLVAYDEQSLSSMQH